MKSLDDLFKIKVHSNNAWHFFDWFKTPFLPHCDIWWHCPPPSQLSPKCHLLIKLRTSFYTVTLVILIQEVVFELKDHFFHWFILISLQASTSSRTGSNKKPSQTSSGGRQTTLFDTNGLFKIFAGSKPNNQFQIYEDPEEVKSKPEDQSRKQGHQDQQATFVSVEAQTKLTANPLESSESGFVPWRIICKHFLFLTLHKKIRYIQEWGKPL